CPKGDDCCPRNRQLAFDPAFASKQTRHRSRLQILLHVDPNWLLSAYQVGRRLLPKLTLLLWRALQPLRYRSSLLARSESPCADKAQQTHMAGTHGRISQL